MIPRSYGPRIASDDWREGLMFAGSDGPMVGARDSVSMHDLGEKVRSWWTRPASDGGFKVRGVLQTVDGTDLLISQDGVYEPVGNFDANDLTITPAATQPKGVLYGRVLTAPGDNPRARDIRALASLGGEGTVYISVRGDAMTPETPPADTRALVVGTSVWAAGSVYEPAPLAGVGGRKFSLLTHDMSIEVGADFCETRIGAGLEFIPSESAKKRPGEGSQ